MALNYLTLQNKPTTHIKDKDGNTQTCIDLLPYTTSSTLVRKTGNQKCIVNKYYVARPDLISLAFYGTDMYADIICKVNGISNPFELNENDMLDIPDLSTIQNYSTVNRVQSELITTDSDISRQRVSKQKENNQKRSPSEQVKGDTNYIIDRTIGLVFY